MSRGTWRPVDAADLAAHLAGPENTTGALRVVVSVRGRVRRGVESHSVVLEGDDGVRYQLGGAYSRLTGRTVLAKGQLRTDLVTTAQEGKVLRVVSIETIDDADPIRLP